MVGQANAHLAYTMEVDYPQLYRDHSNSFDISRLLRCEFQLSHFFVISLIKFNFVS
jgi:hypothetical protein